MNFYSWLLTQGPKESSVVKYERAINGQISTWAREAGLIKGSLQEIKDPQDLADTIAKILSLEVFQEKDRVGNGMYSAALKWLLQYASSQPDLADDIRGLQELASIPETTKEQLVKSRIGQGQFRQGLIKLWGRCSLTGYRDTSLLVASHIKPWLDSSNEERLDPYNGLLLLPNFDKAFDRGLISFDGNGLLLISSELQEPEKVGIQSDMRLNLCKQSQLYMKYHRDHVFIGS